MLIFLTTLPATLSSIFRSRAALQLENLALRHQIGVLQRSARKRPKLTPGDRLLWVWLSRVWRDWSSALAIVKPETVVAWHRAGFRLFWTWKARRGQPGRPVISREIRDLIRKMCRENPGWGAPRIHGELLKLGIDIGESSVSKYMVRGRNPPSQTWRTFLENHAKQLVSIDFFTVPTIRFHVLYVFLVLAHDRRRILHFNVTAHPTAEWAGQQLREAFPFDQLPVICSAIVMLSSAMTSENRCETWTSAKCWSTPRSPWQRAYVERVIGSIRRECLDHVIVFHETSLRRTLDSYFDYYHRSRTHLSLGKDSSHDLFSRRKWDQSWRCPRSVDCTTATNDGPPEKLPCDGAASALPFDICVRTELTCTRAHRLMPLAGLKPVPRTLNFGVSIGQMAAATPRTDFSLGTGSLSPSFGDNERGDAMPIKPGPVFCANTRADAFDETAGRHSKCKSGEHF
jgi:putative transposase